MTPYLGATISALLELSGLISSLLELLMTTPYFGAMISPKLLLEFSSEAELAMFGLSSDELEAACSTEELDFGAAASELDAGFADASELDAGFAEASLEFGSSTEELEVVLPVSALEFGAAVAELDFGVSIDELDSGELSSLADEVLSQLAQKKLVKARAIFFQCL